MGCGGAKRRVQAPALKLEDEPGVRSFVWLLAALSPFEAAAGAGGPAREDGDCPGLKRLTCRLAWAQGEGAMDKGGLSRGLAQCNAN